MRGSIINISKFVGTISLGLLTGVSYSLSRITLPSLLHLPTAPLASQTHAYIRTHARAAQRFLCGLSISALTFAFLISPSRARHPYLLWTALACGLGATPRFVDRLAGRLAASSSSSSSSSRGSNPASRSPTSTDGLSRTETLGESGVIVGQSSSDDDEDVNGEVVRRSVERNQMVESLRAAVWGLAFAMGVVGLWGDGA